MKCKRCGTELRNDDEFCYRCGQRTTVAQRLFSNRAFVGSLIAILIVAAAGVLTYFIWIGEIPFPGRGEDRKEPVAEESVDSGKNSSDGSKDREKPVETPQKTEEPEPTATPFVPSDLTADMKSDLKPLLGHTKPYLALSALYYANGRREFRWGDVPATMMSLYYLHSEKETVKYGEPYSSIEKKVKKEMKDVFGSYAKYNLTYGYTYPDNMYQRTGNTVVYNIERIGLRIRKLDLLKVIEYKEGKYRVIVKGYVLLNNNPGTPPQAEQKYTLYVERRENGKYGYVIRKVALYKKQDGKVK